MIPEDLLPQVGEIIEHAGKQYECVLVEWDRDDDEITVSYRRRYADDQGTPLPDPFKRGWLGVSTATEWVDETRNWRDANLSELWKRQFGG